MGRPRGSKNKKTLEKEKGDTSDTQQQPEDTQEPPVPEGRESDEDMFASQDEPDLLSLTVPAPPAASVDQFTSASPRKSGRARQAPSKFKDISSSAPPTRQSPRGKGKKGKSATFKMSTPICKGPGKRKRGLACEY